MKSPQENGTVVYSSGEKGGFALGDRAQSKKEKDGNKPTPKIPQSAFLSAIGELVAEPPREEISEKVRKDCETFMHALPRVMQERLESLDRIVPEIVKIHGMVSVEERDIQSLRLVSLEKGLTKALNLPGSEVRPANSLEEELALQIERIREILLVRVGLLATEHCSHRKGAMAVVAEMFQQRGIFGEIGRPRGEASRFMDVRREADQLAKAWKALEEETRCEGREHYKRLETALREKATAGLLEALPSGLVVERAEGYDPGTRQGNREYKGGLFHVAVGDGKVRPVEAVGDLQGTFRKMAAIGVVITVASLQEEVLPGGRYFPLTYKGENLSAGTVAGLHKAFHSIVRRGVENARRRLDSSVKAEEERAPYRARATVSAEELLLGGVVGIAYLERPGTWKSWSKGKGASPEEHRNVFFLAERKKKGEPLTVLAFPERFQALLGPSVGPSGEDGLPKGAAGAIIRDLTNRLRSREEKSREVESMKVLHEEKKREEVERREATGKWAEAPVPSPHSDEEKGEDLSEWEEFGEEMAEEELSSA